MGFRKGDLVYVWDSWNDGVPPEEDRLRGYLRVFSHTMPAIDRGKVKLKERFCTIDNPKSGMCEIWEHCEKFNIEDLTKKKP